MAHKPRYNDPWKVLKKNRKTFGPDYPISEQRYIFLCARIMLNMVKPDETFYPHEREQWHILRDYPPAEPSAGEGR